MEHNEISGDCVPGDISNNVAGLTYPNEMCRARQTNRNWLGLLSHTICLVMQDIKGALKIIIDAL